MTLWYALGRVAVSRIAHEVIYSRVCCHSSYIRVLYVAGTCCIQVSSERGNNYCFVCYIE